jgi:transglutaminase-like putative cysteine protease
VIYDVKQTTLCSYATPVSHARHVLRLTPVSRDGERVQVAALQIMPDPVHRREGQDFFGNRLTWIEIDEPHSEVTVKLSARVAVDPPPYPPPLAGEGREGATPLSTPPWEEVRDEAFATSDIGPGSPAHFLFPSRIVSLDPNIRDYVGQSFTPGRAILDAAIEVIKRIKADLVYEIGATTATTTPTMCFAQRRGVCQDFAHVMISGLRGIGLPAAYVSGYLRTVSLTDRPRLQGADAMHAWVMLWCGAESGWIGLDPTNAVLASDAHVMLAIGRDYTDVAPMDGVILGSGGQKIGVSVNVIPVG